MRRAHRRRPVRRPTSAGRAARVRGVRLETRRVHRRRHEVRGDGRGGAPGQGDHARPVRHEAVLRLQLRPLPAALAVDGDRGRREVAENLPRQLVPERRPGKYRAGARDRTRPRGSRGVGTRTS